MTPNGSLATARPGRLLGRVAGVSVILGLSTAAVPATGLAGRLSPPAGGHTLFAVIDLAQFAEALGRGELPIELLVAGSIAALAAGFALTLLVGTVRRRRLSAQDPDPGPAESDDDLETRATLPWPVEDAGEFQPAPPRSVDDMPPPFQRGAPNAPLAAAQAETWAREATSEVARETSGWPPEAPHDVRADDTVAASEPAMRPASAWAAETIDDGSSAAAVASTDAAPDAPPAWERTDPPAPVAAIVSIDPALAPRADTTTSAVSSIGTPEAPLVVELHDGREKRDSRRAGPNLPLVAVIGTVAVGVAFSVGAAVGAALGAGAGAAIGLAFAAGAGVAIGATVTLLGGGRR